MSAYNTHWCQFHGEWEMDIDNPSACPIGITEVQQLQKQNQNLSTELAGCQNTINTLSEELTNLKEAFDALIIDRDYFLNKYEASK